jgi:membrane-associated phospholipid phosphatase
MIQELVEFDRYLMVLINKTWSNTFFDWLMPVLREPRTWIPLYAFFIFYTFRHFRRNSWVIILCAALSVASADRISSGLFKPGFKRERPCYHPAMQEKIELRKKSGCGGRYGFVSSHASNHFALAVFLLFAWRKRAGAKVVCLLLFWAAIVCYAQVYVGVHFPADVFFGALIGIFTGYFFVAVNKFILRKL